AAGAAEQLAGIESLKLALGDDASVKHRFGYGVGTSTVHAELSTKDGGRHVVDARWTVLWEKRNGEWLIVHEHLSAPMTLPERPLPQTPLPEASKPSAPPPAQP